MPTKRMTEYIGDKKVIMKVRKKLNFILIALLDGNKIVNRQCDFSKDGIATFDMAFAKLHELVDVALKEQKVEKVVAKNLLPEEQAFLEKYGMIKITKVERCSDRKFDVGVEGIRHVKSAVSDSYHDYNISLWMPLSIIATLEWDSQKIACMTDYPDMVMTGDWSGVRDSSKEKIWAIVEKFYKE